MKLYTDQIIGPHVILDDPSPNNDKRIIIRTFHAGPGKVTLCIRELRREMTITVDAAALIEAVRELLPETRKRARAAELVPEDEK